MSSEFGILLPDINEVGTGSVVRCVVGRKIIIDTNCFFHFLNEFKAK